LDDLIITDKKKKKEKKSNFPREIDNENAVRPIFICKYYPIKSSKYILNKVAQI
jgi:hypothetical protein